MFVVCLIFRCLENGKNMVTSPVATCSFILKALVSFAIFCFIPFSFGFALNPGSFASCKTIAVTRTSFILPTQMMPAVVLFGSKKSKKPSTASSKQSSSSKANHEKWQPFYDKLLAFQREHGHCNVGMEDDVTLFFWLQEQQESYKQMKLGKKTKLTRKRATALEQMGAIPSTLMDISLP